MEIFVAILVCLLITGYGWWMRSRQMETIHGWIKTKGSIIATGVKEEMRIPVGGAPGKWPMYSPTVKYRFKAGAVEIEGTTIRLYDDVSYWFSSKSMAISRGKKWRKGMTVIVYYDPQDPTNTCLEAITATPFLIMGFGILWLILIPFFTIIMKT